MTCTDGRDIKERPKSFDPTLVKKENQFDHAHPSNYPYSPKNQYTKKDDQPRSAHSPNSYYSSEAKRSTKGTQSSKFLCPPKAQGIKKDDRPRHAYSSNSYHSGAGSSGKGAQNHYTRPSKPFYPSHAGKMRKESHRYPSLPSITLRPPEAQPVMKEKWLHHGPPSKTSYPSSSSSKTAPFHAPAPSSSSKGSTNPSDVRFLKPEILPTHLRNKTINKTSRQSSSWRAAPPDPNPVRSIPYVVPHYMDRIMWPASLKRYIARSFEDILPDEWEAIRKELHAVILEAVLDQVHECLDWDQMPLPSVYRHDSRLAELRKLKEEIIELDRLQKIEDEEREKVWFDRKIKREITEQEENMRMKKEGDEIAIKSTPARSVASNSAPINGVVWDQKGSQREKGQSHHSNCGGSGEQEGKNSMPETEDDDDCMSEVLFELSDDKGQSSPRAQNEEVETLKGQGLERMSDGGSISNKQYNTSRFPWDGKPLYPEDSISQVGTAHNSDHCRVPSDAEVQKTKAITPFTRGKGTFDTRSVDQPTSARGFQGQGNGVVPSLIKFQAWNAYRSDRGSVDSTAFSQDTSTRSSISSYHKSDGCVTTSRSPMIAQDISKGFDGICEQGGRLARVEDMGYHTSYVKSEVRNLSHKGEIAAENQRSTSLYTQPSDRQNLQGVGSRRAQSHAGIHRSESAFSYTASDVARSETHHPFKQTHGVNNDFPPSQTSINRTLKAANTIEEDWDEAF